MQWTLNDLHNWEELRELVDTALLPLYLYRPSISLPMQANRMQYLMELAVAIEQKLKGRLLLFPLAYRKWEESVESELPEELPFTFVLRFSGDNWLLKSELADSPIHYLTISDEELDSRVRFEVTVDVCYQQIIKTWQQKSLQMK
ncbi:DUF2487 family protein [Brevibacillus ginsengisoli]|uniref:DUF2487 family protein n=1 Tax=Brevibacillus ginsengisoli TaxID=363854 RepID=UPI003CFBBE82